MRNLNEYSKGRCEMPSLGEYKCLQWIRGLPLSLVGVFVFAALYVVGKRPQSYHGVPYFSVGKNWGGFSMGWFFVCGRDVTDSTKKHEVGHGVQNALRGGLQMLFCCIASCVRYWWRRITRNNTGYYDWWFEKNASDLGAEFINLRILEEQESTYERT